MGFPVTCNAAHVGQPQHHAGLTEPSGLATLIVAGQPHGGQMLQLLKLALSAAKAGSWPEYCCTWFVPKPVALCCAVLCDVVLNQHLASCMAAGTTSIPVHHFLRSMAPIIARNPDVFLEAVRATCSIEDTTSPGGVGSRVLVVLKKGKVGLAITIFCGLLVSTDQAWRGSVVDRARLVLMGLLVRTVSVSFE